MLCALGVTPVLAGDNPSPRERLEQAEAWFGRGQYFRAARYAFEAQQEDRSLQGRAYSLAAVSLMQAGLKNTSIYFAIRGLQTGSVDDQRRLLPYTDEWVTVGGLDLMKGFLLKHTRPEDYPEAERGFLDYALGQQALLRGREAEAAD